MQTCLQVLGLLSAYNAPNSAHIFSDYAKKLFRILHPSNLTNIRTPTSVKYSRPIYHKKFANVLLKKWNRNSFLQKKLFGVKKPKG